MLKTQISKKKLGFSQVDKIKKRFKTFKTNMCYAHKPFFHNYYVSKLKTKTVFYI